MKVLFISNLFPDTSAPNRGLVNARLLRHLAHRAEIRVLAPRPSVTGWWRKEVFTSALKEDQAFSPRYPQVPYVPKVGSRFNDWLYAARIRWSLAEVRKSYSFDVVLCSWLYPDAAAVERLARQLHFPYVAIAQGSDVHQYLPMPARHRRIVATVNRSSATVARSQELARLLRLAGAEATKLKVIYNGVETEVFKPGDQHLERAGLGLAPEAKIILYVGNLLPVKNPGLAIESLAKVSAMRPARDIKLVMVGTGPLETSLRQRAEILGVAAQVIWAGVQKPDQVARHLRACDVLCLPSLNEGMPNVLLEAFASGRPVVATNVGGIAEILNRPELGRLVASQDSDGMALALNEILTRKSDEVEIARVGKGYSWTDTAKGYFELLERAVSSCLLTGKNGGEYRESILT